jgi:hypothetical protein
MSSLWPDAHRRSVNSSFETHSRDGSKSRHGLVGHSYDRARDRVYHSLLLLGSHSGHRRDGQIDFCYIVEGQKSERASGDARGGGGLGALGLERLTRERAKLLSPAARVCPPRGSTTIELRPHAEISAGQGQDQSTMHSALLARWPVRTCDFGSLLSN